MHKEAHKKKEKDNKKRSGILLNADLSIESSLQGILMPLVGVVGLCGNLLSVGVLSAKEMNNSFNKLLIALAFFDTTFIIFVLFDYTVVRGVYHFREGLNKPISEQIP